MEVRKLLVLFEDALMARTAGKRSLEYALRRRPPRRATCRRRRLNSRKNPLFEFASSFSTSRSKSHVVSCLGDQDRTMPARSLPCTAVHASPLRRSCLQLPDHDPTV
jgi:hypothetical protein